MRILIHGKFSGAELCTISQYGTIFSIKHPASFPNENT